ncbi:MAG: hypothetical protein ABJM36_08580 [Algibacter sp.]|uniref:hypothetical protein n=1 Tax=Algibacter sp. TaxID=1872428 RepID=UPI00329772CF
MKKVMTGLDVLLSDVSLQNSFKGRIALLCYNTSNDSTCTTQRLEILGHPKTEPFGLVNALNSFENLQDYQLQLTEIKFY